MKKEWYIILNNKQEGPYTLLELKGNPYFTPDTLVWKKGLTEWLPARKVAELKSIFVDQPKAVPLHEKAKPKPTSKELGQQDVVMTLSRDPFQFIIWIIIVFVIIFYLYFRMNNI